MSVTTWSNIPDSVDDQLGIRSTPQPGEVNNRVIGGAISLTQGQKAGEFATYRASESDLAPSQENGMMGTVRNNGGFATTKVTPDSTIEIPGFGRTSVKVAESLGYLTRAGDGRYVETARLGKAGGSSEGGPLEESKATPNEAQENGAELFGCGFEEDYSELIKDVPQGVYDSIIASANAHISEGMDLDGITEKLAPRLASAMGIEPKAAAAMLDEGGTLWQVQADMTIEKHGADPEDFYQWAKSNRKNELQQAVNSHLFQRSTKGYSKLVNDYFDNTIPTVAALKAGGIPVEERGGEVMVKLKGHWMTVGAAVKARLV